ncbi:hypothetical protein MKEN_00233400 [Mycena kentingensis (nom. inval.)]|nr:hypothetical protein MKEN_00233400 [Mycena kentingensis (nom. inval.)]
MTSSSSAPQKRDYSSTLSTMPLFKPSPPPPPPPPEPAPPPRKPTGGLFDFGLRRAPAPDLHPTPATQTTAYHSAHSRTRSDATSSDTASERSSFFFRPNKMTRCRGTDASSPPTEPEPPHASQSSIRSFTSSLRLKNFSSLAQRDPKVVMAREKVAQAHEAEAEADRAVEHARARVRDALEQIKELEDESNQEAMRAKSKRAEAGIVSKAAKALGRHG